LLGNGHHGDGRAGGQPVGLVVAAGVEADLVGGAVEERDGAEPGQAGARLAWRHRERERVGEDRHRGLPGRSRRFSSRTEVLVVGLLLTLHEQQAVAVPQLGHALGAHGHLGVLAVLHQRVADAVAAADAPGGAGTSGFAGGS